MRWLELGLTIILLYIVYLTLRDELEWFQQRDPLLDTLRSELSVLHPKLENIELFVDDKSYTLNKRRVFVCMKDSQGRYYHRNMLAYVICHEYAHILCHEIDHTPRFFEIFHDLLERAAERGLYDPNIPPLTDYCGHE